MAIFETSVCREKVQNNLLERGDSHKILLLYIKQQQQIIKLNAFL